MTQPLIMGSTDRPSTNRLSGPVTPYVKPYTLADQIGAQFKLENTIGSTAVYLQDRTVFGFEDDPDWQAEAWLDENYKDASPEERFAVWGAIHDSNSQADAEQKMAVAREFKKAREIRDTMGTWDSLWTGALAGITDPITLATLAIPVGAATTAGRGALKIGGLVTAESAALEVALHTQQDARTLKESALNVTANAILGGVVGSFGGAVANSRIKRDEARDAIRRGLDEDAIEIDDINAEIGSDFGSIEELDAALAQSELSGAAIIRNTKTSKWNPTLRGATNEYSMNVRGVWQQIASNSFLTRQAKEGEVGTASMSSATTAIETATGRFSGRQHTVLLDALKEWNRGKSIGQRAEDKLRGWDAFLEEVGMGFRTFGDEASEKLPDWQKKMYGDLIKIQKDYESLLSRKGFIDQLTYVRTLPATRNAKTGKLETKQIEKNVVDLERTEASLAKSKRRLDEAKIAIFKKQQKIADDARKVKRKKRKALDPNAKPKKTPAEQIEAIQGRMQRLEDDIETKTAWLKLIKRYKNGDQTAASEILERIHGERRYQTQSWNKTSVMKDKDGWKSAVANAEKAWYNNQISKYGPDTAMGRQFRRDLGNLDIGSKAYDDRLEEIYKELSEDNNPLTLGGFDNKGSKGPSQTKARVLKIDQTMMVDYLKNNFMDLNNSHYSSVLPDLELRSRGLDKEGLEKIEKLIKKEYSLHRERARAAGDVDLINNLDKSETEALKDINHGIDLIRNEQYDNITQMTRDVTFVISQFNATRQLGTMLIASLGDIAGVVAKTGIKNIAKAVAPTLRGFNKVIKDSTRSEIREMVGIMEMVSASRVHALNSSAELGVNQTAWARLAGRVSKSFYKASGILWWNQAVKEMAILGYSSRILEVNPRGMSKTDLAWFARDGMDRKKLEAIHNLYKRYPVPSEYDVKVINTGKIYEEFAKSKGDPQITADARLADEWNALLTKHANRSVVTPEAGDLPRWMATSPAMKLVGQYKGFGSSSINKTTIPMAQGIAMGDAHMAFGFLGLTVMGTGTYMLRQKLYDRPMSDQWQTLAYEGLLRGGALGLYSDAISMSQEVSNNWFTLGEKLGIQGASKYYSRSIVQDLFGPTVGLAEDIGSSVNAASRWMSGETLSDSDRARGLRMLPFNNLFYLRAVTENWDKFQ